MKRNVQTVIFILLTIFLLVLTGCFEKSKSDEKEEVKYTVTFESNGGSGVKSKSAEYNTTITAPANPTKTGYTFVGWYKEAGLTNVWNFANDKVTGNITLHAKWNEIIIPKYTVTFETTPLENYIFDTVNCTNNQVGEFDQVNNILSIKNLNNDTKCVVQFKQNKHHI